MSFPTLNIGDLIAKTPIVQGGMGVGISLSRLASAVANEGGIGVIAIPEMRRFYRHVLVAGRFPHHGVLAFEKAGKNLYTVLSLLGAKADFNRPKTMLYEGENPFSL